MVYTMTMVNKEFSRIMENKEFFPGELRFWEDYVSRWDINVWLNTGRTDHFYVADIIRSIPTQGGR